VADRLDAELERARSANDVIATSIKDRRKRRIDSLLRWPDA
jgi:hypothetical protein